MTKLLNDVLILGKAEAGKLEFNPAPLDLENYCRNLVEELQLNDSNKHIITFTCSQRLGDFREWESGRVGEVSVNPESSQSPPHLLTKAPVTPSPERSGSPSVPCMDEKLLRQILENLLSNAIKYSPSGGNVELTLSDFSNQAVFQIRDHGIGIPAEDQQQLFETFHRATNVGTIAGTGLGLAIVKRCVDIHQGQITVESEVGVGTTFTVTLPIYNSLVP
jgi:signal transduction histidine kinase